MKKEIKFCPACKQTIGSTTNCFMCDDYRIHKNDENKHPERATPPNLDIKLPVIDTSDIKM